MNLSQKEKSEANQDKYGLFANLISTGLLHLEQSLTQQRFLGWIRVSRAADVNIYYKPLSAKSADRGITYGFHFQPHGIGSCCL